MLTRKQHTLLMFIHDRLQETGVCPSFDEMRDALGLKSKSGVHRLITSLEERGFLTRLAHKARALEVTRLPEGMSPATGANPQDPAISAPPSAPASNDNATVPLYGKIAAGTPIEALMDPSEYIPVPPNMLGGGDCYALTVDGDSMVEAGILDGDYVIIERCENAPDGTIVVALVDREEATLKTLRRKGSTVALEPANRHYETRIYGPDRVQVQGRLVGLVRQY